MPSATYRRSCDICSATLKKNGRTKAGTQRLRCPTCGHSTTIKKAATSARHVMRWFVTWLTTSFDPTTVGISTCTFRRKIAPLWQIQPRPSPTGEVHDIVTLDGTWIAGMVCLIASSPTDVITWHWAKKEDATSWTALLDTIPAPRVVIVDGGAGIAKALRTSRPTTKVQRYLFHIFCNIKRETTLRTVFAPSQDALHLARALMKVSTSEEAIAWQKELARLYNQHSPVLAEKTITTNRYGNGTRVFTHQRSRKAFNILNTRVRAGDLFTFLDPQLISLIGPIPRTTNRLEGGINSPLKAQLARHRGIPPAHQRALTDWFLYTRTENPEDPHVVAARYNSQQA